MGKMATKKALAQLQKLFDVLGEYGGVIETDDPGTWWNLDLEVQAIDGDEWEVMIGIFSNFNGDIIYDPQFNITVTVKDGKVDKTEIYSYYATTLFGTSMIDENDMICNQGKPKKDKEGLVKRFSQFMDNMTETDHYLTDGKIVKKYDGSMID